MQPASERPDGSETPALPVTWRPLGVRLASVFFGALLFIVCAVAWLTFDPEVKAKFSAYQRGTLVVMGLGVVALLHALGRARVTATQAGLTVVNGWRTRQYEWAEVLAVHLPSGAPWATVDLSDGTTASLTALQSSDGIRARRAVLEIRSLLER